MSTVQIIMVRTLGLLVHHVYDVRNVVHTGCMAEQRVHQFTLGDRLRKARMATGLSSQDMADLLDASRTTVSNYEHGRTEPTATVAARWAELTDVNLVWLITGEDDDDVRSRCFPHDDHQLPLFTLAA
jgi:DNA-binding XRE family transcriptional regulator